MSSRRAARSPAGPPPRAGRAAGVPDGRRRPRRLRRARSIRGARRCLGHPAHRRRWRPPRLRPGRVIGWRLPVTTTPSTRVKLGRTAGCGRVARCCRGPRSRPDGLRLVAGRSRSGCAPQLVPRHHHLVDGPCPAAARNSSRRGRCRCRGRGRSRRPIRAVRLEVDRGSPGVGDVVALDHDVSTGGHGDALASAPCEDRVVDPHALVTLAAARVGRRRRSPRRRRGSGDRSARRRSTPSSRTPCWPTSASWKARSSSPACGFAPMISRSWTTSSVPPTTRRWLRRSTARGGREQGGAVPVDREALAVDEQQGPLDAVPTTRLQPHDTAVRRAIDQRLQLCGDVRAARGVDRGDRRGSAPPIPAPAAAGGIASRHEDQPQHSARGPDRHDRREAIEWYPSSGAGGTPR